MGGAPQRPFRGPDHPAEAQLTPLYKLLDHGLNEDNFANRAVLPIRVGPAVLGGGLQILPGQINWTAVTFTIASSAATQAVTITFENLGRTAIGYLNIFNDPFQAPAFAGASTGLWNATQIVLAFTSFASSASFRLLVL